MNVRISWILFILEHQSLTPIIIFCPLSVLKLVSGLQMQTTYTSNTMNSVSWRWATSQGHKRGFFQYYFQLY